MKEDNKQNNRNTKRNRKEGKVVITEINKIRQFFCISKYYFLLVERFPNFIFIE
jgi:hypothetical protein